MAAHTKGFMFPFQKIQEVLPIVEYFDPKRSKDWGAMPSIKTSSQGSYTSVDNQQCMKIVKRIILLKKLCPNLGEGMNGTRNYKLI